MDRSIKIIFLSVLLLVLLYAGLSQISQSKVFAQPKNSNKKVIYIGQITDYESRDETVEEIAD